MSPARRTAVRFSHKRVFLIPLDARPVCYDLPRRLAASVGLELGLPAPNLLGQLKQPADEAALMRWVKNHLFENDPLIVALDTIAYGGLIPSRVHHDPLEMMEERLDKFYHMIQADAVLGFSSILRIPSYNNAEEEPDYWAQYGSLLYQYSVAAHEKQNQPGTLEALRQQIPKDVLHDFLTRRERNFLLNQGHLKRLVRGDLDYLTFCQDDTGPFGLNVQEAETLAALIQKKKCQDKSHVQTGADEVAACMLARLLAQWHLKAGGQPLRIHPIYSDPNGSQIRAKFDGIPIGHIVERAIRTCGAVSSDSAEAADLWLLVHTPAKDKAQGDHCELPWSRPQWRGKPPASSEQHQRILDAWREAQTKKMPVALTDVAYANGSDPVLTEHLLNQAGPLSALYGYGGWNTPGNAIGTTVAMAVTRWIAEQHKQFDTDEFNKLLLIRLGDDWLYQSQVRKRLREQFSAPNETILGNPALPPEELLNVEMANGLALIKSRLQLSKVPSQCHFPCGRTFEVEIAL